MSDPPADPLSRHREEVESVLATQDPAAIKQLYVRLGDYLLDHASAGGSFPILSVPGTAAAVARQLPPLPGLYLDAGCGPHPVGTIEMNLVPRRRFVVLDIASGIVQLAVAEGRANGANLVGVVADLEHLPFRDGVFDGLVCDDTIEHLPNDAAGVRELARVTRAGGVAVLATPNRNRLEVLSRKGKNRLKARHVPASTYFAASSHLREYSWGEFRKLTAPYFVELRYAHVPWSRGRGARFLSKYCRGPLAHRLSAVVVLVLEPR
jgi:SAM-dependent methyltransferase